MLRGALFALAGLVAGLVIATLSRDDGASAPLRYTEGGTVERRLVALERERADEAARNVELRARLEALEQTVETLGGAWRLVDAPDVGTAPGRRIGLADGFHEPTGNEPPSPVGSGGEFESEEEWRISLLVDAGFSEERALWIGRRRSELAMEALQARYDAARGGEGVVAESALDPDRALLAELGDEDYLRYLEAMNRPTSVGIREVLANSPAERAGLRAGDQIVAYGGERVFAMSELNRLTLQGQPGELVAIDVLRDGEQIQLYVPRGPVGVTSGGRLAPRR